MQTRCGIYLWGANIDLVYPWYNLRQPKISLVYLEALVYTRDIPSICQNTKTYQRGRDSRCSPCSGLDSTVQFPCNYLVELHCHGAAATVKFHCNFCFHCGPNAWWRILQMCFSRLVQMQGYKKKNEAGKTIEKIDSCSKKLC